jgi:1-acyl-sn-glycerol-3-phosphate acyltransferase
LAEQFKKATELHLAITPEGTRKANPDWKMGFYHIAKKADIPILLVGLDFKEKKAIIIELFRPTGDEERDIKYIKEKYMNITAKYPELFDLGLA